MTPAQVENVVLEEIARDTAQARFDEPVVAELLNITLLAVGQSYRMTGGGISSEQSVTWAVDFRGVAVSCTRTCQVHTAGTYIVDDASGGITAAGFNDGRPCPRC
jgi:hypothetical protein